MLSTRPYSYALVRFLSEIIAAVKSNKVSFFVEAENESHTLQKFSLFDRATSILSDILHPLGSLVGVRFACMGILEYLLLVVSLIQALFTRPELFDCFNDVGYELSPIEMFVAVDIDFLEQPIEGIQKFQPIVQSVFDSMAHDPEEAVQGEAGIPVRFKLGLEQIEISMLQQHHDLFGGVHGVLIDQQCRVAL